MGRGRPKGELSRLRSIRLPERFWVLLEEYSAKRYRSTNATVQMLVEDFLVSKGLIDDSERKRPYRRRDEIEKGDI